MGTIEILLLVAIVGGALAVRSFEKRGQRIENHISEMLSELRLIRADVSRLTLRALVPDADAARAIEKREAEYQAAKDEATRGIDISKQVS